MKLIPALLLAAFSGAVSASGFQLMEQNASGIGNAYAGSAAVAENASTIYYNPAGMTQLQAHEISGGVSAVNPSFRFNDKGSSVGVHAGTGEGGNAGGLAFIPNGYDEADFAELPQPVHDPEFFTIVHTGTFYGQRDPDVLLEGIARYLTNSPSGTRTNARHLRVRLVGNMGARFSHALQAFEKRFPGVVQTVPYMPHAQALAELASADALLLVVGGGQGAAVRGWLPGKMFEYLRIGKPVLTLGDPEGDAAALIRRHANGIVIKSDDADGLAHALGALVSGQLNNRLPNDEHLQSADIFERCELARQLAAFLRECQSHHLNTSQNKNR